MAKFLLGIQERWTDTPAPIRLVSPAQGGFVKFGADESFLEAFADKDSESYAAAIEGCIRPEILAIEEGRTKNNNIYIGRQLAGGKMDEDGNPSGVASWFTPFPKPILKNHDMMEDPLGRVLTPEDARASRVGGKFRILIYPTITQPDAIQKMLRKEYLTGSVGVYTDSAKCSVCGHDFIETQDWCDHMKGRRYDKEGKPDPKGDVAGWILGALWNQEYSVVNQPAKYNSGILRVNTKEFEEFLKTSGISDYDMVMTSETVGRKSNCYNCKGDEGSQSCDGKCGCKAEPAEAFFLVKLHEHRSTWMPGGSGQNTSKEEASMSISAMDTVEAKLSTAARKKLPDSAFCGPGRSYPAHDAAHVRNGLARLSQFGAKLPAGTRASILACLRARAKKMGVTTSKGSGKGESQGPGDEALKLFDSLVAYYGNLDEDFKKIAAMSAEDTEKMVNAEWKKEDQEGAATAEKEELAAEGEFLKALSEAVFCGPNRSFPVPNETYAEIAKSILSWPSVSEKMTKEQRAGIMGKIAAQELLFEDGSLKDVKVEFPKWAEADDYVSAAICIERTLENCIEGLKQGQESQKPAPTCKTCTEDLEFKGASEAAVKQLEEQLSLERETSKTLRTEVEALKVELTAKGTEIESLQEQNAKLGALKHKELIDHIVLVKKEAGDKRDEKVLREHYGKLSIESLEALMEEFKSDTSKTKMPTEVKPQYSEAKPPTTPDTKVDSAGGEPQSDAKKKERVERMQELAKETGAIGQDGSKGQSQ